jgi:hypothetical protein
MPFTERSQQDFTSKELGKVIKKTVREIETGEGVLIFDDTLQEKPHSKENDLICWHALSTKPDKPVAVV